MKTSELSPMEKLVLELAVEDYYGLFEIVVDFKNQFLEFEKSKLNKEISKVVISLIQKGFISLYRRDSNSKNEIEIPSGEIESVLSNEAIWEVWKNNSVEVAFGATEKGEEFYYALDQRKNKDRNKP